MDRIRLIPLLCGAILLQPLLPDSARSQVQDTVTLGGMQLQVSLVNPSPPDHRNRLTAVSFDTASEFYHVGWLDPVTLYGTDYIISNSEPPEEIGLPEGSVSPNGRLRISCLPVWEEEHAFRISIYGESVFVDDDRGNVSGIFRINGETKGRYDDWPVLWSQTGVRIPDNLEDEFWSDLIAGDTLNIRVEDATGDRSTYVFVLEGLEPLAEEMTNCP